METDVKFVALSAKRICGCFVFVGSSCVFFPTFC